MAMSTHGLSTTDPRERTLAPGGSPTWTQLGVWEKLLGLTCPAAGQMCPYAMLNLSGGEPYPEASRHLICLFLKFCICIRFPVPLGPQRPVLPGCKLPLGAELA